MPSGFLGGRGSLLVDVVFVCNLIAPAWALVAASAARRGEHAKHMRLQLTLWAVMIANLLLLEGHIRLSGGSGSVTAGSPYAGTTLMTVVFLAHVVPAVATYMVWSGLVFVTYRRRASLGGFGPRHRALGKAVIGGLVWTALSACAIYYLTFLA
ncbi:MAG: hypothetical protein ABL963_11225 [Longimicrobiales bacterium]